MSETEIGITAPPPDKFVLEAHGVRAWRPVFEAIRVDDLPGGCRRVQVTKNSEIVASFDLGAQEAAHLATLLAG